MDDNGCCCWKCTEGYDEDDEDNDDDNDNEDVDSDDESCSALEEPFMKPKIAKYFSSISSFLSFATRKLT